MAKILFLSPYFRPDGVSTAQIMSDLALDLSRLGHKVSVITARPHYNRDEIAEQQQPLSPLWGRILMQSRLCDIPVLHAWVPRRRHPFAFRAAGLLSFHLVAFAAAMTRDERPDIIIVPSPILTVGWLAWLIGRLRGSVFVYNVQELYPDLAIDMGWLRNGFLIAILTRLESFVYAKAAAITTIGKKMARRIVEKGVDPAKVHVIPNFADTAALRPVDRDNDFARAHNLAGQFVVCYAGNLGRAQGLDVILSAAALLRDAPEVTFAFVGDGGYRDALMRSADAEGLTNVRFIPHQPYARVAEIYAASDMCLVPLLDGLGATAVPSKVFRILACGRPVVALADETSDLASVITESGTGEVVPPSDAQALAGLIRAMKDHPDDLAGMGARGRQFVIERYSRETVSGAYDRLVRQHTD